MVMLRLSLLEVAVLNAKDGKALQIYCPVNCGEHVIHALKHAFEFAII